VKSYLKNLIGATAKKFPSYAKIGLYIQDGERIQLNENILQIENEYYSPVRPKQIAKRCERPACTLLNRGVEYMEVRVLDVDPFSSNGISKKTALFVEVMLMTCFDNKFNDYSQEKVTIAKQNLTTVAIEGRKPALKILKANGQKVELKAYALELFTNIERMAKQMGQEYLSAVLAEKQKVLDSTKTPSAKLIKLAKEHGYKNTVLDISKKVSKEYRNYKLSESDNDVFKLKAKESIEIEKSLSSNNKISLAEYIDAYYQSADGCC
jgi:glutamate--cysteine ligase